MAYGTRVVLKEDCERVVSRVTEALAEQDFVVVTKLDLREALESTLSISMPDQIVLGVCRKPLADVALRVEPSLGLLLPIHVVVRAEAPDVTVVEAVNPVMMVALTGDPTLEPLVTDAATRLAAALHSLQPASKGQPTTTRAPSPAMS